MQLERDGAELISGAAAASIDDLVTALAPVDAGSAGERLFGELGLDAFVGSDSTIGKHLEQKAHASLQPVRAVLFDKNINANWALTWHQDRVIAVKARQHVPDYGSWTVKSGIHHVAPPAKLLERMLTVRIHLDDVGAENAPLLIAPGSHRLGLIVESDIPSVVEQCGTIACAAARGDVWVYRTLILHASERATVPRRRRVLQVDYSPDALDGGLEWLGVK